MTHGNRPSRDLVRLLRVLQLCALALAAVCAFGIWLTLARPNLGLDVWTTSIGQVFANLTGSVVADQGLQGSMVETKPERRIAAPGFELDLFEGGRLPLDRLQGSIVVLNFWASWCVPCRNEAPALEKIWRTSRNRGAEFVGIDIQDTDEAARAFIDEFAISYANGPDRTTRIAGDYGVSGIPVTLIVDRAGRIARRWVGELNEQQLGAIVDRALAE